MKRTGKPPKGLSSDAKGLWVRLVEEYEIDDAAGLAILAAGLESFDRANEAKKVLDKEGPIMTDRWGQKKPHPGVGVEIANRAAYLNAIRLLNLDVLDSKRGPGRPPGCSHGED